MRVRSVVRAAMALAVGAGLLISGVAVAASSRTNDDGGPKTTTPIKHLVVIFQENVSFDHCIGTEI